MNKYIAKDAGQDISLFSELKNHDARHDAGQNVEARNERDSH